MHQARRRGHRRGATKMRRSVGANYWWAGHNANIKVAFGRINAVGRGAQNEFTRAVPDRQGSLFLGFAWRCVGDRLEDGVAGHRCLPLLAAPWTEQRSNAVRFCANPHDGLIAVLASLIH
jgi:hypothetical protein